MVRFEHASVSISQNGLDGDADNQDCFGIFPSKNRLVVVVADGAGGTSAGKVAASFIVNCVKENFHNIHHSNQWEEFLTNVNFQILEGQSTAVVLDIRPYGVAGVSVGDSQAWIVERDSIVELTKNQIRKPLLGNNDCRPVSFLGEPTDGMILVGSDGFFNYAKREDITRLIGVEDFFSIPRKCVDLVRLRSNSLWDDTTIIAIRIQQQKQTKKTYAI